MTTEISNTGSLPGDQVLVGAVSAGPRSHHVLPADAASTNRDTPAADRDRPRADGRADAPVTSCFRSANTLQDAHRVMLESLDKLSRITSVVHFDPRAEDESTGLQRLRYDSTDPHAASHLAQLSSVCQQSAHSGQIHSRRQLAPERIIIAFPVATGRQPTQSLGLIAALPTDLEGFLVAVEKLVEQFALWILHHRLQQQSAIAAHAAAALELVTRALGSQHRSEACQVIVTELAGHLNLRRAAIGIAAAGSDSCRLIALSDASRIDATTAQTRAIENAMDEALMLGSITTAGPSDAGTVAPRSAGELARQLAAGVLVVPLVDEARDARAVILAVIDSETPVEPIRQFLDAARDALGAVLDAIDQRRSHPLARRFRHAVRSRAGALVMAAAVVFLAAMFIPFPHRETCDVRIEPRFKRFVAAPFDATLKDCFVQPGDLVRSGDLLASLDGRELTWKRDALQADHDQAIKKRDAAQASRAYADQRIAQLEIDGLRAELNLLDLRLSELELRSPVDGMVVTGDLIRAKGAPLTTGQSLFEIAPLEEMIVEASICDDQIASIRENQTGRLRLNAYPNRSWDTTVRRVNPRSEIREEENVFIAECPLANEDSLLRPGMKGTLKIDCGRRALGWILFHRPAEAVSQWFWW